MRVARRQPPDDWPASLTVYFHTDFILLVQLVTFPAGVTTISRGCGTLYYHEVELTLTVSVNQAVPARNTMLGNLFSRLGEVAVSQRR